MTVQAPTNEDLLVREIRQMPREYWPNLLQLRQFQKNTYPETPLQSPGKPAILGHLFFWNGLIRLFRESVTLKPAEPSFRQGWQKVMTGQTRPVSELWEGIDAE
ncbi:MAG: hypothetical protein AUK03_00630 [Anaerolineae bacterium CG2_30_64_16]|nr:MAG: hypothetical protein AUK03_00630 [Anaerolineae bacterium CG2_30_64_16]